MRNLNDMKDFYNPQDCTLLCKIIENRFELMYNTYDFNARKCNSASTLSGCIERDLSKIIIVLPTSKAIVKIFEKTVTSGFSCVNKRSAFDTEILMSIYTNSEYDKMSIDQSFKSYKRQDLKIGYKLKLDGEKTHTDKRIASKILELYENNQYGYAMTKSMPTGCIKEKTKHFNMKRIFFNA